MPLPIPARTPSARRAASGLTRATLTTRRTGRPRAGHPSARSTTDLPTRLTSGSRARGTGGAYSGRTANPGAPSASGYATRTSARRSARPRRRPAKARRAAGPG